MTKSAVLRALEKPILTEFPCQMRDDGDFDDLSEKVGWR